MPIYEYRCPHCGHQFEAMHAVNAAPPKCERCGRAVRRVFTPVGIIFKGSGWHITDYRKTPAPADGETKKSDAAPSDQKSADKKSGDGGSAPSTGTAAADGGKKSGTGSKSGSRSGGGSAS